MREGGGAAAHGAGRARGSQVDLLTVEGLARSTQWEDWGIDKDVNNAGVGRGRW